MDFFLSLTLLFIAAWLVNRHQQRQRATLLGHYLRPYQIEKLMETLVEGYLRAMGEAQAERRAQILGILQSSEAQLCQQMEHFAADLQRAPEALARISRLPVSLPFAQLLWHGGATFDLRKAIDLHAQGIARVARNAAHLSERDKAFMMTAEVLLLQHTCHWFCRSWLVACARAAAHHQTQHAQILAAVSPETRAAYQALRGSSTNTSP